MSNNKKKGIISISIISVLIVVLGLIVLVLGIRYFKNKKVISNDEKIYFNETVILCSEIYGSSYELPETPTSYERVVAELDSHIKAYEQLIFSSNFRHKRKVINEEVYKYQMKLSYYSIDKTQYVYTVKYNYDKDNSIINGEIKADYLDFKLEFNSSVIEGLYTTTINYNDILYKSTYEDDIYSIDYVSSSTKVSYLINKDEGYFQIGPSKIVSLTLSQKLSFTLSRYDFLSVVVDVSTTVVDGTYCYLYEFQDGSKKNFTTKK